MRTSFLILVLLSLMPSVNAQQQLPASEAQRRNIQAREVNRSQDMMLLRGGGTTANSIHLLTPQTELSMFFRDLNKASSGLKAALGREDAKKRVKELDKHAEKAIKLSMKIRKRLNNNQHVPELSAIALTSTEDPVVKTSSLVEEIERLAEDLELHKSEVIWTDNPVALEKARKSLEQLEQYAATLRMLVKN